MVALIYTHLVGGLEHLIFFRILGISWSWSQLTNSYFSEGLCWPPTRLNSKEVHMGLSNFNASGSLLRLDVAGMMRELLCLLGHVTPEMVEFQVRSQKCPCYPCFVLLLHPASEWPGMNKIALQMPSMGNSHCHETWPWRYRGAPPISVIASFKWSPPIDHPFHSNYI